MRHFVCTVLLHVSLVVICWARSASDLYCGKDNCYSLLDLDRSATAAEIKKSYRKLALKWHPDKNKSPSATETFRKISRAHEVLSDETIRKAYEYFLDHPEDEYTHYYNYYHAVYAPKTPLWAVISGALLFLSVLQHINQNWKYSSMMRAIKYQPSFKRRVNELLESEAANHKGKLSKVEKEVLRDRIEKRVLEEEVRVSGSGFGKPSVRSLVAVQAVLLPMTLSVALYNNFQWFWRFTIKGEQYGDAEKLYLTQRALGISEDGWMSMEESRQQDLINRRLWQREQLLAYIEEQQEEFMQKRAQSGAYKRAKRWMKNH